MTTKPKWLMPVFIFLAGFLCGELYGCLRLMYLLAKNDLLK